LVSAKKISQDPENDTTYVPEAFADEYGLDLSNWTVLAGYDFRGHARTIKTFLF